MTVAGKAATKPADTDVMPTPLELMAGQAWRGAFLTTYSLSVSFLETQVVPVLEEEERCEIDVLVDAKGYRDSLFERHSWRVGQDYRLVPVAMPRGCFHAKTALLWGAERDLLVIGSGNLTFGGHGRNLEVFEAFEPAHDAAVFAGFAEFLAALRERLGDRLLGSERVAQALLEARRMAGGASPGRVGELQAQILHSVQRPILDQIVSIADDLGLGECLCLSVLSPFFDADAGTVRRLAQALRCRQIRVSVPPSADENRFPFAKAGGWTETVRSVRLAGGDRRSPHAKVLEMRFKAGTLVLTGSVNATRPALGSTDNIEIGVLRLFEHGPFRWVTAPTPPGVASDEAGEADDVRERILHAVVTKEGRLLGQLLGTDGGCTGAWRASVAAAGLQVGAVFTADAAADGRFASEDFDVGSVVDSGALQVILERPGLRACGWLQVEALLSGGRLGRMSSTEILRLSLGRGTSADVTALLEYLARHLVHDRALRRAFRSRADQDERAKVMLGQADLMPGDPDRGQEWAEEGVDHRAETRMTLERIRRCLLRRPAMVLSIESEGVFEDGPGAPGPEEGGSGCGKGPVESEEAFSISEFESIMRDALTEWEGHPAEMAETLTMWFEGLMTAYLHAAEDRAADARSFLHFWTMKTLQGMRRGVTPAIDGLAVTAAAMSFALRRRAGQSPASLMALRTAFDRWWGGAVAPERAGALLMPRRLACVAEIIGLMEKGHGQEWDAAEALDGLLAVVTPDRLVREALDRWRTGLPPFDDASIFATTAGQKLRRSLASWPARRPLTFPANVVVCHATAKACPSCGLELGATAQELELRGVAVCRWYGEILIRTEA